MSTAPNLFVATIPRMRTQPDTYSVACTDVLPRPSENLFVSTNKRPIDFTRCRQMKCSRKVDDLNVPGPPWHVCGLISWYL